MTFHIRAVAETDISSITAIYREAVLNGVASYELQPPSHEEMIARIAAITQKAYPCIVAEAEDGAILGYAYASAFRTRPAYRWLVEDSIYLSPQAQGRGVGKALLRELTNRAEALGFRQMVAVIGGASPASVALHRACGFEMSGTLKGTGFKHGRWLDTILMQKALGEGTGTDPDPGVYPGTLHGT